MNTAIKNILKSIYYTANKLTLPQDHEFELGFVFHTEEIFNPEIFKTLVSFCKEYETITNAQCICVTMTPPNKRVEKGMKKFGCSNGEYRNRMLELHSVAHVGFHGHFWTDPERFEDASYDIKKHNIAYDYSVLERQFKEQADWFAEYNVEHHNTYSGGWWFINKDLIHLLLRYNYKYDYTISKSPNLWNPYTIDLVNRNNILYGEAFYTTDGNKKLLHIQNLHSGHNSPYPQDAHRFMNKLVDKKLKRINGVLNSHDYCLDYEYTLGWIRNLKKLPNVKFESHRELISVAEGLKTLVV